MARRLAVSEATIRRALHRAGLRRQTTPAAALPIEAGPPTPAEPPDPPPPGSAAAAAALPLEAPAPTPAALPNIPAPVASAALASEPAATAVAPPQEVAPPAPRANPGVPATLPGPEAAPLPAAPLAADNAPAGVFSIDLDPADRSGDRALARLGVLQDAAPLFGDHQELPRAGVLLAVPVLHAHGGLAVFTRL